MSNNYTFYSELTLAQVAQRIRAQQKQGFNLASLLLEAPKPTVILKNESLEVTRFERVNLKTVFSGSFIKDHPKASLVLTGIIDSPFAIQAYFAGSVIAIVLFFLAVFLLLEGEAIISLLLGGAALLSGIISYSAGKTSEDIIVRYIRELLQCQHPTKT